MLCVFYFSFVKYRKIPAPLAVVFCFFLNRPEHYILLSCSIYNITVSIHVHMLHDATLYILYGHGKIQKKSDRDSSFTFVLLLLRTVFDTQCVRRCLNAYFYPLLFFQCVIYDFQCVNTLLRALSVADS